MITSIRLRNFKGHRDTTLPLRRMTVLVGPNGAGKTSLLQALNLLSRLVQEPPNHVLSGESAPRDLISRSVPTRLVSMEAQGVEGESPWSVTVELSEPPPQKSPVHRLAWMEGLIQGAKDNPDATLQSLWDRPVLTQAVGNTVFYHFDASRIAAPAYSAEEEPVVEENGENTAVVLAHLKLDREDVFNQISAEFRKIVPNVKRVHVTRAKFQAGNITLMGNRILLDFKGAADVPAHAASEGTLITLALLTALCSPNHPRVILLDDIERSLHPQAQMELVRELKKLLESFPDVQIIATTHSPYILDEMSPKDVWALALRDDGSVALKSLAEHPQAAQMEGALTTGQLWSLDPEWRWVLGQK